jgi:hypothetical protein
MQRHIDQYPDNQIERCSHSSVVAHSSHPISVLSKQFSSLRFLSCNHSIGLLPLPRTWTHDFPIEVFGQSWLLPHAMPVTPTLQPLKQG